MSILITGGSGFVGLNIAESLLARGERIVLFDRKPPPASAVRAFSPLPGTLHLIEGDVVNAGALNTAFLEHGVDRVIHTAAITSGTERERRDARVILQVNVLGTVEVLEIARRHGVRRFLHLSSGAVYGQSAFEVPELDEERVSPVPDTLYSISKYAGECTSLRYKTLWGMDLLVARLSTVFGRWEYDTGVRDTLSVPVLVTKLAEAGTQAILPRPGLRDWIYGPDVARGLIGLLDLNKPSYSVYNVGPGSCWTIEDWCARLSRRFPGFSCRLARHPAEANVDFYSERDRSPLSIARLREDTGFEIQFGLDEAFRDYTEWRTRYRL